ncbi:TRAP transporter substrate-binding protein DctP [Pararhodobacter oceanensis]|uniref:TRAP transporter substrate-binding protein DctP n=1 Tax=Pararhodobacter oceanensis TaxID=2172121 RepID=UPI003A91A574
MAHDWKFARMIGFSALLCTSASMATAQDDTVYTLRYQASHPSNQAYVTLNGQGFRDLVEEMSGGRIQFEVYDAGALVSVTGMLEAVDQGVLDISQSWGGFYTGDVPEADVEVGLPLAWEAPWQAYDAYFNRGLGEVIEEAYESRFNVEWFPAIISLQYGIALREDIDSLADLEGLRIRAIGIYGALAQSLGASAAVIPGAEIYTALQLGTVDGIVYGTAAIHEQDLQGFLQAMILEPNMNTGVGHWVVNRDTWNSLPEDLQQVISFAANYGNLAQAMRYTAEETASIPVLEAAGVRMISLDAADRATMTAAAMEIWDGIAERSELAGHAVEIVRQQMRDYGRLN